MSSFNPAPNATAIDFVAKPIADPDGPEKTFVATGVGGGGVDVVVVHKPTPEEIREEAYAEGVAAGRAELPWQEAEELRGLIETLEEALSGVAELRRHPAHGLPRSESQARVGVAGIVKP